MIALIGESGSGKTTISLACMGYARPGCEIADGSVRLGDRQILDLSLRERRPTGTVRVRRRHFSGGERQRVNLARALAAEPKLIVCDEITSALDTVVAQAILDLLRDLQERLDVGYLFISHDISTVARVADTIAVMQNGEVVEYSSTGTVPSPPHHPYTELVLKSVPDMRTDWLDTLELPGGGGAGVRRP